MQINNSSPSRRTSIPKMSDQDLSRLILETEGDLVDTQEAIKKAEVSYEQTKMVLDRLKQDGDINDSDYERILGIYKENVKIAKSTAPIVESTVDNLNTVFEKRL